MFMQQKINLILNYYEALFPKSLNAHEVESIVSLERSRSMKSVKSNKRSSFVNYDGSDDNIVHYVGPISNQLLVTMVIMVLPDQILF